AVDGYAVSPHLGTRAELAALVLECRRRGIALLQDQVANHVGPAHRWAGDPPTPTWIHRRAPNAFRGADVFSPHASPPARRRTLDGWFGDLLPDLNQDDPECATWLIQNALWWVGTFGFGGIRQDTVPYVPTKFWHRWSQALRAEFPGISLLGEVNYYEPALVAHWMRGGLPRRDRDAGFDQGYDFPLQGALRHVFAENGPLTALSETLARDPIYPDAERLVTFVGLHDTPRFASLAPDWALPLAFAFVFLTRGTPLVYYGDEIAMQGKDDPETRAHFPGGFPVDGRDAFTRAGRSPFEESLRGTIAALARLRRSHRSLRAGGRTVFVATEAERLAWVRHPAGSSPEADGSLLCVVHREPETEAAILEDLGTVRLPKRSAGIWERRRGAWVPRVVVDGSGFHDAG
ncbi:MAG: alpha-amylase family glycosyl hydrolase, partial [Armatimonadota bacterium]